MEVGECGSGVAVAVDVDGDVMPGGRAGRLFSKLLFGEECCGEFGR